ncbi:hypothetical protein DFH29DRAFT_929804 [Suillus ampliporus]|nr:hypothetical protein DFH29DRAFT_929804 [Suillus ampliporus]
MKTVVPLYHAIVNFTDWIFIILHIVVPTRGFRSLPSLLSFVPPRLSLLLSLVLVYRHLRRSGEIKGTAGDDSCSPSPSPFTLYGLLYRWCSRSRCVVRFCA